MTDHAAEQEMEIEALEAIYADELEEVADNMPSGWHPHGKAYRVVLTPQEEDPDTEYPLRMELVFAHTATYPDEPPLLKARGLQGLSDADVRAMEGVLQEQVEANLGMAMIYTLIGAAQEWLNEKMSQVGAPSVDPEAERRRLEEAEERRIAELRAHGTAVTPEAFADWKARFDAEMALQRTKLAAESGGSSSGADKAGRLTGKQWFMQQEARHLEVEEVVLEADEADGEDEANWGPEDDEGEEEEEEIEDFEDDDSDDDALLDEMLAAKGS